MKKQLSVLALSLISASAFAAGFGSGIETAGDVANVKQEAVKVGPVSVNANVNATTNLVDGGRTLTKKNPSVYANVGATLPTAYGNVGVEYGIAKLNGDTNPSNSRQDVFITFGKNVAGVDLIGKFGERRFGGVHAKDGTSQNVILGAAYKGAFVAVDKTVSTTGTATFDTVEKVGYTYAVNPKLSVTGSLNYAQLGQHAQTRYSFTEVRADYAVTKNVSVGAVATKGGKNLDGTSVPSQFGATLSYAF